HREVAATLAPFEQRVSWIYDMSVFESKMGMNWQVDLTKSWDAEENRHVVDVSVVWFLCPANSQRGDNDLWTHHVGIAGVGKDAINLPLADPNIGLFGFGRNATMQQIIIGTSNTMAVAESRRDNDRWAKPGHATVRGVDPEGGAYLGENGQFNSWH